MDAKLDSIVHQIVELLVAGRYAEIAILTNNQRLDGEAIQRAVRDYGRKLVMPPSDPFNLLDVIQVEDAAPPCWSVRMPLWTVEEGRSDLSLELTITENGSDYTVELDDIHVL
jgi:hypothetical protein